MNSKVRFEDIWNLFQENHIPCTTDIVYLDSRYWRSNVIAKRMIDDCFYLYTCKDKYIYLYGGDLLERILVWARDPRSFSRKGFLGSHLSIGLRDDNTIDIHETIYETEKGWNSQTIISKKKKVIHYTISDENTLIKTKRVPSSRYDTTLDIWNEILCVLKDKSLLQHGGKSRRLNLTKSQTLYRLFHYQKKSHTLDEGDQIAKIQIWLTNVSNKNVAFALLAISYVHPHDTLKFLEQVQSVCEGKNIKMIRDTYYKTCVLLYEFLS